MSKRLRNLLLNWVVKHYLNGVVLKEVWEKRDNEFAEDWILLATDLKDNKLLNKLLDELDYLACIKMFHKSQTPDDLMFGKALLYNNDLLRKKIKLMASGNYTGAKDLGR